MNLSVYKRAFSDRLGLRLVLISLLISTCLSALATGFQLYVSYQQQRDDITRVFDQIGRVIVSPLETALWKFDNEQVDVILDGVFSNEAVAVLTLETPNGNRWERGQGEAFDLQQRYELAHDDPRGERVIVGYLAAHLTLVDVHNRIWAQFWTVMGSNLIKAYLSASMLLLLFFFFVTKPLKEIAEFVERRGDRLDGEDLTLSRSPTAQDDDLDKIVAALNLSRKKLDQKINDLSKEVATRKAAEIEARRSSEVRKTFLANMSHEVRTPLNAIMGLFQLIQMADVPERQKLQAEVGLNASHQLLGQLTNVLDISRLESNGVTVTAKPIDVRVLAAQWLETAKATRHRLNKPVEVTLVVEEGTPESVSLDTRHVTQIVSNLTDNALKFTKEGRVEISVECEVDGIDGNARALNISVSDTGRGIDADELSSVFDRFVQLDNAETRENTGSGLGLAISRELAHLMGASLDVTSPSKDSSYATTFTLRIPIDPETGNTS